MVPTLVIEPDRTDPMKINAPLRRALLPLALASSLPAAPLEVRETRIATWEPTGVTIVKGTVDLPRHVLPDWPAYTAAGELSEICLPFDENWESRFEGERFAQLQDRKAIRQRRWEVWSVLRACEVHARKNNGIGPATLAQAGIVNKDLHLMPKVRIFEQGKEPDRWERVESGETILIDLAPGIADGEHHVARTDGQQVERIPIDAERMEALGLVVTPQAPAFADRLTQQEKTYPQIIYARLTAEPGKVTIPLRDSDTGQPLPVEWDLRKAKPGQPEQCQQWALERCWMIAANTGPEAIAARSWITLTHEQYQLEELGEDASPLVSRPGNNDRNGGTTSMMSILGGRAAIEETLQLRNLRLADEEGADWTPTVPLAEIEGVTVEAHPFTEMLDGRKGGHLPLADWVPRDRFFLYVAEPGKVFSLLDGGSAFLGKAGSGLTSRSVSHDIKQRYLDDLGMSETLLRRFLDTGAIEEMGLVLPDLHLIDGTEMSAILRTGRPLLANAALALVGVPPGDGRTVRKTPSGREVHWERRGDVVMVSTSEPELEALLEAHDTGTSLGQSAEFRYMLTQLPVTDGTVIYTYFSDPFIRKLVGPAAKIGQFRRLLARAELEEAAAGALAAGFDGRDGADLPRLRELGYVRPPVFVSDLVLHEDGRTLSEQFGSPRRMRTLRELPLDRVSKREQEAYDAYRDRYNQYWRRFFDPIAIRYQQDGDGGHDLETFILPLIDNSIYEGLRHILPAPEETPPLRVPVVEPAPVGVLSWNLREEALLNALEGFRDDFEGALGLDPRLLDLLETDMHLVLSDADPIITIGSGELDGFFGAFGSDADEMLAISTIVSILTRPCTLQIGLTDPQRARKLLASMTWEDLDEDNNGFFGMGAGSLYRIAGRDQWIYRYTLEDVITFRFGIEVQDRFLIINNQPFSNPVKVTGHRFADQGAARLALHPAACREQGPALLASAAEQQRRNTLAAASALLPLVLTTDGDPDTAMARHRELFGFTPVHPDGGSWTFDPYLGLGSSMFGYMRKPVQPAFDPEAGTLGLFTGVDGTEVSMQFEQDGLRATARWQVKQDE